MNYKNGIPIDENFDARTKRQIESAVDELFTNDNIMIDILLSLEPRETLPGCWQIVDESTGEIFIPDTYFDSWLLCCKGISDIKMLSKVPDKRKAHGPKIN